MFLAAIFLPSRTFLGSVEQSTKYLQRMVPTNFKKKEFLLNKTKICAYLA